MTQALLNAAPGSDEALARDLGLLVRNLLGRTNRSVFGAFEEHELSFTQAKIVMSFGTTAAPQRSIKTIADDHGLSLAATSRAVDSLLKRGLVTRSEDQGDRRIKQIALTGAGREITHRMFELRAAGILEFVKELDPEQRRRLGEALAPVVPGGHADSLFPVPAETSRKDPTDA